MKHLLQIVTLISALGLSGQAPAALIGEDVQGQFLGSVLGTETIIDPGVEFSVTGSSGAVASADLNDTQIILSLFTGSIAAIGLNFQWSFTLVNPDLTFVSISELSDQFANGSSFVGFSNGNNTASFTILDQSFSTPNQTISAVYNVNVADASAIPLPGTLILMSIGLLGFAAHRSVKGMAEKPQLLCRT